MDLEQALVAATALWRARRLPTLDRCGHLMACPWQRTLAQACFVRCGLLCIRAGDTVDIAPFDGATGDTPRVHRGLTQRSDTLDELRADLVAVCHTAT